ncbi:MAG: hypothetical protein ACLR6W_07795 [Evtepia sp.]
MKKMDLLYGISSSLLLGSCIGFVILTAISFSNGRRSLCVMLLFLCISVGFVHFRSNSLATRGTFFVAMTDLVMLSGMVLAGFLSSYNVQEGHAIFGNSDVTAVLVLLILSMGTFFHVATAKDALPSL